jgi:hypothetical protein
MMAPHASIMGKLSYAMLIVPGQSVFMALTLLRVNRPQNAIRTRLLRAAVYGVMLAVLFAHSMVEQRIMRSQAEAIVNACHAYSEDYGHLPENLSELIPSYLPTLREELGFISSRTYFYYPPKDGNRGAFVYHPEMFYRSWYFFDTRQWTTFGT